MQAKKEPSLFDSLGMLPAVIMIGIAFYFLLLRPQKAEQRKREGMIQSLKKNDRVITIGGIYGVIANIRPEADEVTLKVDEGTNTKLRLRLSAIERRIDVDAGKDKGSEESGGAKEGGKENEGSKGKA